jgi:hypothetical protein
MATSVSKDSFKTTNMKFSDLDNKFFNKTDAANGVRRIKMSKFVKKTRDHISNGEEFTFQPGVSQPTSLVQSGAGRARLTDKYADGPIDATENASIKTSKNNMSMSHYKGSITFYKVIQTGTDDHNTHSNGYIIENQSWNGNLNKFIPKQFEQWGTMGTNDVNKYACIFEGTATNLQFAINGGIYGAGASTQYESGGNAMYVAGQGDRVPIRLANTAQLYAGGGWGGFGGVGGPGGKGGGSNGSRGGTGGSGGTRGTGGRGRGYGQNAATGTSGGSGGNGNSGGSEVTWYKGALANPNLYFTNNQPRNNPENGGGGLEVAVENAPSCACGQRSQDREGIR